jgi:sugar/nucleoside kinase (ribokinase family)
LVAMDFFRPLDILIGATILQCSPESLGRFGGPKGTSEEIVRALPAPTCILTEGAAGGLVKEAEQLWRFPAYPILDVIDTTGAGDAFRAGLCYGLVQNWSLQRTIRFASAVAACHCRRLGGAAQIPLQEIQALLSKNS